MTRIAIRGVLWNGKIEHDRIHSLVVREKIRKGISYAHICKILDKYKGWRSQKEHLKIKELGAEMHFMLRTGKQKMSVGNQ